MEQSKKQNLFILSAPSGTGKNTVFKALQKKNPMIRRVVTVTTRSPRRDEVDGKDYLFYTENEFKRISDKGGFIEQNCYNKKLYGTPENQIHMWADDLPVFVIVDTNGKNKILEKYPLSTTIFLLPPSVETLEHRIRNRGENSEDEIKDRLRIALNEILEAKSYDYVIINDNLDKCAEELLKIVKDKMNF